MSFTEALHVMNEAIESDDPGGVLMQLGDLDLTGLKPDQIALLYAMTPGTCITEYLPPGSATRFANLMAVGGICFQEYWSDD